MWSSTRCAASMPCSISCGAAASYRRRRKARRGKGQRVSGGERMRRTYPFIFLNLAHFLDHYFMLIFPAAVLAIHREWGWGYGETMWLGMASSVALALST